jgi:hypothetical protein
MKLYQLVTHYGTYRQYDTIAIFLIKQSKPSIERIVLLDFIHRLVSQKIEELKTNSPEPTWTR